MEYAVLQGARDTITRLRPIIYVENDRKEKSSALISLIFELGYNACWDIARMFNPKNFFENNTDVFEKNLCSINMIFIPKETQITLNGFKKVENITDTW